MTAETDQNPQTASETTTEEARQDQPEEGGASTDKGPSNVSETNSQPVENAKEIGGRGGLDPARYGDWEVNGRCYDF